MNSKNKANVDIREYARQHGVCLWEIADKLSMEDNQFSRYLRKELTEDKKQELRAIVDELSKEA